MRGMRYIQALFIVIARSALDRWSIHHMANIDNQSTNHTHLRAVEHPDTIIMFLYHQQENLHGPNKCKHRENI